MQTPMVQLFVGQCVEQLVSQCADLRYLHKAQIRRKRTIVGQTISVPVRGPNSLPFVPSDILSPARTVAVTKSTDCEEVEFGFA